MLYSLFSSYVEIFSFLNVFKFLTVRTGLAMFTSMLVVFLSEFWFIEWSIIAQNDAFFIVFYNTPIPWNLHQAVNRHSQWVTA